MEVISYEHYFFAFALTLFAGLSTSIGAALAFFSKAKNEKFLSFGLGFSAGVMVYVSFVEILKKSNDAFIQIYNNQFIAESLTLLCFIFGIVLTALIDYLVPKDVNPHETKSNKQLEELKPNNKITNKISLKRTGVFTALAIGIHNFPEGFATFIAALDDLTLGLTIAIAIAIHNIPEGMAVSLPIYHSTNNKKKAFWYATASGLAEPIGAIVGFLYYYLFYKKLL